MGRRIAALLGIGLLAVAVGAGGARTTEAAWTDGEIAVAGVAAGTVAPVTAMSCTGGLGSATFNWTAPVGGLPRSGYRWTLVGDLSGQTIASGTAAASATSVSISSSLLSVAVATFRLYAVGPGGWESGAISGSATVVSLVVVCSVP